MYYRLSLLALAMALPFCRALSVVEEVNHDLGDVEIHELSSTPQLTFHLIPILQTCAPTVISWDYKGESIPISIHIAKITDETGSSESSRTITLDLDASSSKYFWDSVNVPQGWYTIYARFPSSTSLSPAISARFLVTEAPTVSCSLMRFPLRTPGITVSAISSASTTDATASDSAVNYRAAGIAASIIAMLSILLLATLVYLHSWCTSVPEYSRISDVESMYLTETDMDGRRHSTESLTSFTSTLFDSDVPMLKLFP